MSKNDQTPSSSVEINHIRVHILAPTAEHDPRHRREWIRAPHTVRIAYILCVSLFIHAETPKQAYYSTSVGQAENLYRLLTLG
jgi:hypothetical protein